MTEDVARPSFARRRFRARLRRLRPYLLAGSAVVLVVVAVWLVAFSSVLTVRSVEVTGNTTLPAAGIERFAKVPAGEQLVRLDLAAIRARVEAIPSVESAEVSRSWPRTVTIDVTERVPVAAVERNGRFQAVDASGVLFASYAKRPADLPLVKVQADVKASALAEAAQVIGSLRADIAERVEYLEVVTADEITLQLTGGTKVLWGSAKQSEQKAEVLAVLIRKKHDRIDVSVPGRPTTR